MLAAVILACDDRPVARAEGIRVDLPGAGVIILVVIDRQQGQRAVTQAEGQRGDQQG